jgi:hypothetical protein
MFSLDVRLMVFMAAITGIRCITGWMTGLAGDQSLVAMLK